MKEFYAHSLEGKPVDDWQGLEEHLTPPQSSPCQGEVGGVAAKKFGDEFGSGEWAYLAGLPLAMKLHRKALKHVS